MAKKDIRATYMTFCSFESKKIEFYMPNAYVS